MVKGTLIVNGARTPNSARKPNGARWTEWRTRGPFLNNPIVYSSSIGSCGSLKNQNMSTILDF